MIKINLLPKDEQPKNRSIQLPNVGVFAPLVVVFVTFMAIGGAHIYQGQKISALKDTIAMEEAETRRLAPEIAKIKRLNKQRKDLNDRLDVITRLDSDRYFRVHIMDELNRTIPEHMWITRFEDVGGDTYAVEGVTFSNFLISDFMQNLTSSPFFGGVSLLVAEKGDIGEVKVIKFKARAQAVRKPAGQPYKG